VQRALAVQYGHAQIVSILTGLERPVQPSA